MLKMFPDSVVSSHRSADVTMTSQVLLSLIFISIITLTWLIKDSDLLMSDYFMVIFDDI